VARVACCGRPGLGPRSDDENAGFDEVGLDVVKRFENDEPLIVTVLTLMGKDYVVAAVPDHDA